MGFLDKLFGNKKNNQKVQGDYKNIPVNKRGVVSTDKIEIDEDIISLLKKRYIAFDVETYGLSPQNDRIVEVGAVLFENGVPVKKYGTLVNAMVDISLEASSVNHINNSMIKNSPSEKEVYEKLIDFLGDVIQEKTVICAHNARFDLDFLSATLMRLGYDARIRYVDTLSLARRFVKGLENYKQDTVASHFNLYNQNTHRAESDAEICGSILWNLLKLIEEKQVKKRIEYEKNKPSEEEMEVCAVIQNMITLRNGSTDLLGFYKNSSGYVDVCYIYNIAKFKFAKKGKYIIVKKTMEGIDDYINEPCTMSEGGSDFIRVFFNSPLDLEKMGDYIFEEYNDIRNSALQWLSYDDSYLKEYKHGVIMNNSLTTAEVEHILSIVQNKDYQVEKLVIDTKKMIDRASIEITPTNNRVEINKIKNLNNFNRGFDLGFPFWEKGEEHPKAGDILGAIDLFDQARLNGYCAPALFSSYAMAYRKIKDYDNEIDILDEAIERLSKQGGNVSESITRRNKAIELLLKQRDKEEIDKQKIVAKNKKNEETKTNQKRVGQPILQLDEDMNVIERFETISDASRKIGVNSKSIREAAKGIQKHAGGFVWRYADMDDSE